MIHPALGGSLRLKKTFKNQKTATSSKRVCYGFSGGASRTVFRYMEPYQTVLILWYNMLIYNILYSISMKVRYTLLFIYTALFAPYLPLICHLFAVTFS